MEYRYFAFERHKFAYYLRGVIFIVIFIVIVLSEFCEFTKI